MLKLRFPFARLPLAALVLAGPAAAVTITFDDLGLAHGDVVDSQYAGVTISAINSSDGPDLAVVFDSDLSGTRDPDLEFGTGWLGGNLAPDTKLGNLLIIQENSTGCSDGTCDRPDDEGSRPAGVLIFDFDVAVTSFGFDVVDIENVMDENGSITFFDGASSTTIAMSTFLAGLTLGDNTANTVTPFDVAGLDGISQIDRVELSFAGSGAIDNVTFDPVPEPSTALLLGLGVAGLAARTRIRSH
ncbi:MAG: PEP-CTERM sorting domain-containing protein [Myxococcota bacterium]